MKGSQSESLVTHSWKTPLEEVVTQLHTRAAAYTAHAPLDPFRSDAAQVLKRITYPQPGEENQRPRTNRFVNRCDASGKEPARSTRAAYAPYVALYARS